MARVSLSALRCVNKGDHSHPQSLSVKPTAIAGATSALVDADEAVINEVERQRMANDFGTSSTKRWSAA